MRLLYKSMSGSCLKHNLISEVANMDITVTYMETVNFKLVKICWKKSVDLMQLMNQWLNFFSAHLILKHLLVDSPDRKQGKISRNSWKIELSGAVLVFTNQLSILPVSSCQSDFIPSFLLPFSSTSVLLRSQATSGLLLLLFDHYLCNLHVTFYLPSAFHVCYRFQLTRIFKITSM